MENERLWAPWRLGYIKGTREPAKAPKPLGLLPGADANCFICRGVVDDQDRENMIVARGPHSVVLLNAYPYANGHLLVAPRLHKAALADQTPEEQLEILTEITRFVAVLQKLLKAEGFNIGLNLGRVAGAGLPGHLHWHIVPRWNGDHNFMPALAAIHVIPQSLDELWHLLSEELQGQSTSNPSPSGRG